MSGMTSLGNHDKKSSWNSTSTKLSAQIAAFYKKRSDENPIIKSILTSSQKESNIERSRLMKDYRSKLLTIKVRKIYINY